MRLLFIILLLITSFCSHAQKFLHEENDTTLLVEYRNGTQWGYREHNGLIIDVSNVAVKDKYGKYFQINIYIKNIGDRTILFQPERISSSIVTKKDKTEDLLVYSYDDYMKRIIRKQKSEEFWSSLAIGFSAGMSGYKTANVSGWSYNSGFYSGTISYYDNAAITSTLLAGEQYMDNLELKHNGDQVLKSKGYLRITTIKPGNEIFGHINIKRRKGKSMKISIPVGDYTYIYDWDLQNIR